MWLTATLRHSAKRPLSATLLTIESQRARFFISGRFGKCEGKIVSIPYTSQSNEKSGRPCRKGPPPSRLRHASAKAASGAIWTPVKTNRCFKHMFNSVDQKSCIGTCDCARLIAPEIFILDLASKPVRPENKSRKRAKSCRATFRTTLHRFPLTIRSAHFCTTRTGLHKHPCLCLPVDTYSTCICWHFSIPVEV